MTNPFNHTSVIVDSFVGVAAPFIGVITSFQEQLEYKLQIASLIIGILVGSASLIRIIRKL